MKNKAYDDKISACVRGRIHQHDSSDGKHNWLLGDVVTPLGIVTVYSQGGNGDRPHTRLDFVFDGVLHMRNFRQRYSERGLATIAARFAREIVNRS